MNKSVYNQILMMAAAEYYDVLSVLAEMLHQHAAALGLMAPGFPQQLGINNGVDVTANGQPIYYAVVPCRNSREVRSIRVLRAELQDALDEVCYGADFGRLYVLSARYLPGGYVGLTLTWGVW